MASGKKLFCYNGLTKSGSAERISLLSEMKLTEQLEHLNDRMC